MNVASLRRLQPLSAGYAVPIVGRAREFLRWWIAEIHALLPSRLRDAIERRRQNLFIDIDDGDLTIAIGSWDNNRQLSRIRGDSDNGCGDALPRGVRQTILLMPDRKALVRQLALPLAAEENLREVLAFEMDQMTPFAAADVCYDYVITGRSAEVRELYVDLVYSPRREIERQLESLAARGFDVDVVSTRALAGNKPRLVNLLPQERRRSRNRQLRQINVALLGLFAVLLAVAIALPIAQKGREIARVESEVEAAAVQAREGSQVRAELERLAQTSRFLTARKQTATLTIQLIDEVSRVLPDHTSLSRLDLAGTELQIQGQSAASAELISLIDASPLFENARFRAPVVQIRDTDLERFHLSADVVKGGGK